MEQTNERKEQGRPVRILKNKLSNGSKDILISNYPVASFWLHWVFVVHVGFSLLPVGFL